MEEEEKPRSSTKKILLILVALFLLSLITLYWLFPITSVNFDFDAPKTDNFSLSSKKEMQFYSNMRFQEKNISYTIDEKCNLQRQEDMKRAFEIMENLTILDFEPSEEGLIKIYCEKRDKREAIEKGFFIAGEGGPVNVTIGKYFNVIQGGEIILMKNSNCERPNVAIHELLHVLGFDHSENSNNIMYPISKCKQTIGQDMLDKINELYVYPSLPDLEFEGASAQMKGRVLDLNISIKNQGLADSSDFEIIVYGDGKEIKKIESEGINVGYTQKITITNQLITKLKIEKLELSIKGNFEEINKDNNKIVLKIIS